MRETLRGEFYGERKVQSRCKALFLRFLLKFFLVFG